MSSTDVTPEKSGISRRDLIKKGAVAGAIVWTVPFIESVPAYAATGSVISSTCSYFVLVYTLPGSTTVYADRITSSGSCAGNTTSADVIWCWTCPGTADTYDNYGSKQPPYNQNNAIRLNGQILSSSGCTANQYFSVTGNTIQAINGASILFAVAHAGSLNTTTGQEPGTPNSNGTACNNALSQGKVNVFCGPITSASFDCIPSSTG